MQPNAARGSPAPTFARAALHALAREEALGRRPPRLTEPDQATWRRFRGRMTDTDFLNLVVEDAAVTQPFAFDAAAILGSDAPRLSRLPPHDVAAWLRALTPDRLQAPSDAYLAEQAQRLGLPTRLNRSELSRAIRPHHRVLELPGTGGQLAHHLAASLDGVYLQDVFTIAWAGWTDRLMAGLVAVEHRLTGRAPIAEAPGLDAIRAAGGRFDLVIGAHPDRAPLAADPYTPADLEAWFSGARVNLV